MTVGRVSRVDARQIRAMDQATERLLGRKIARIKVALKRTDDADDGASVAGGGTIALGPLAGDPTIPTCRACATASWR